MAEAATLRIQVGDFTPNYLCNADAMSRIHKTATEPSRYRFVVVVREPVARAFSEWRSDRPPFEPGTHRRCADALTGVPVFVSRYVSVRAQVQVGARQQLQLGDGACGCAAAQVRTQALILTLTLSLTLALTLTLALALALTRCSPKLYGAPHLLRALPTNLLARYLRKCFGGGRAMQCLATSLQP